MILKGEYSLLCSHQKSRPWHVRQFAQDQRGKKWQSPGWTLTLSDFKVLPRFLKPHRLSPGTWLHTQAHRGEGSRLLGTAGPRHHCRQHEEPSPPRGCCWGSCKAPCVGWQGPQRAWHAGEACTEPSFSRLARRGTLTRSWERTHTVQWLSNSVTAHSGILLCG